HDAVRAAQNYIQAGKDWVVDMDITKFFDRVNHDILMQRIGQTIRDKRVLRLIGKYLRAGVMIEGVVQSSEEGTPQGGPLSPLLANIYLDALDQELEGRGLAFSRYADDCNIYVSSQRAAERVLASITEWISKHLRLEVKIGRASCRETCRDQRKQERQAEDGIRGGHVTGVQTCALPIWPLSPLLANIYLDALDQELEGRGLAFSRYADDCNIYVSSQRAAERVLASITEWISKHLRLEV